MIDKNLLDLLVKRAQTYEKDFGKENLFSMRYSSEECGCLGARHGEPFCSCKMNRLLHQNLPIVLEIMGYKEEALNLMRKRLVTSLGG